GLFFVLVGTALAIFQGLRISRPIKMLAWRADQIARGDLETRVEISSGDEIGMLGENFNYMADRLLILMRETAEKATLEKELEVMNRAIFESAKRKFVMTCFASILDPKARTITYANAGHNFPYLFRPGVGDGQDFQVLMSRGNRLGDLEESRYDEKSQPLRPN